MNEFIECDTCRAKPGSPPLCSGCLKNRATIYAYEKAAKNKTIEDRAAGCRFYVMAGSVWLAAGCTTPDLVKGSIAIVVGVALVLAGVWIVLPPKNV